MHAGTPRGGGGGGGHSRFQVMGMFEGFFGVGKFGKYFLGIQNNLKIRGSARIIRPHSSAIKVQPNLFSFQATFKARKFGMGFMFNLLQTGKSKLFHRNLTWGSLVQSTTFPSIFLRAQL